MTRQNAPRQDLDEQLAKQVKFLVRSSRSFDEGYDEEALRLAVSIRLLVHDTARSHSLLGQMGLRNQMLYLDTGFRYSKRNIMPESALAMTRIDLSSAGGASWVPRLHRPNQDRWLGIHRWWSDEAVIRDARGKQFSRQNLVLHAANQDGGAHVDPHLDEDYEVLTRHNSMGFKYTSSEAEFDFQNGPALPSIRMIAHELLVSIQEVAPSTLGEVRVRTMATAFESPESVWESAVER